MTWEEIKKASVKIFEEYGIPPAVGLSQMAVESGRGTSNRAKTQNNYFGFAVYSDNSSGKSYTSPLDSVRDYAKLISQDPRYAKAMKVANDPAKMVEEIKKAGYAADPNYVAKVTNTPEFREYAKTPTKAVAGAATKAVPRPTMTVEQFVHDQKSKGNKSTTGHLMELYNKGTGQNLPVPNTKKSNPLGMVNQVMGSIVPKAEASYTPQNYSPVANYVSNPSAGQGYTVKSGDTLWGIAQKYLGNGANYKQLGYSGNPNSLPVGTRLNVPTTQNYSSVPKPAQNYSAPKFPSFAPATYGPPSPKTLDINFTPGATLRSYT